VFTNLGALSPLTMARDQFELDFIREFQHSGAQLGPDVSREERRERIRVAILREGKETLLYHDTQLTYAQIYQQAYSQPIELRRFRRESPPVEDLPEDETDDLSAEEYPTADLATPI
jgi:hypothetical protein